MRLLVLEDDPDLSRQLRDRLRAAGYVVDQATDARTGAYFGEEYPLDLAIVDVGLPDGSGIEVVRGWRRRDLRFPVLILTARGRWQDKVEGLEAGADDYLVKPFAMEELLARARALLRRSAGWADAVLRWESLALDPGGQTVSVGGAPVELTAFEYRILEYLMHRPGQVVSKSELSEHLYPDDQDRDSNVLEVMLARLRRKLDPAGTLQPIETLRGRGYRLRRGTPPPDAPAK